VEKSILNRFLHFAPLLSAKAEMGGFGRNDPAPFQQSNMITQTDRLYCHAEPDGKASGSSNLLFYPNHQSQEKKLIRKARSSPQAP